MGVRGLGYTWKRGYKFLQKALTREKWRVIIYLVFVERVPTNAGNPSSHKHGSRQTDIQRNILPLGIIHVQSCAL